MANFFNNFPATFYTNSDTSNSLDTVTNIIARFGFESSLKENSSGFYKYTIKDSDTPEIIASKFYDNPERHWIVLLFNDIIDPQFDWPLKSDTLITYINNKYSANGANNSPTPQTGIQWALDTDNVESYYKIVTRKLSGINVDNKTIVEKIKIDATTYTNLSVTTRTLTLKNGKTVTESVSKTKQTYYEYEVESNDLKREIKLLKPEFVPSVVEEFKRIISPS
jgi:hypothetical protein